MTDFWQLHLFLSTCLVNFSLYYISSLAITDCRTYWFYKLFFKFKNIWLLDLKYLVIRFIKIFSQVKFHYWRGKTAGHRSGQECLPNWERKPSDPSGQPGQCEDCTLSLYSGGAAQPGPWPGPALPGNINEEHPTLSHLISSSQFRTEKIWINLYTMRMTA